MREHAIRGAFSSLATAVTLYMSAEYAELFLRVRQPWAAGLTVVCAGLAIIEIWKVGRRVEFIMGLRSNGSKV